MDPLKIIFAGTPEFAALHLNALRESKHQLIAVYTQPDRPAGRGKKLTASPVKKLALATGLPVFQPASLKNEQAQAELATLGADVMIVVAYGLILPQEVLDAPRRGCLNVHASLLPRWRGAAPIQRAIEAGDAQTGITIMQMDAGLDTGDILATVSCTIGPDTSAASLHDELATLGGPLLLQVLQDLPGYQGRRQEQSEDGATYASKILKPEARIDWQQSATELDRTIRAFNPFPVCFSTLGSDRVKVQQAKLAGTGPLPDTPGTILRANEDGILVNCGQGQLSLQTLQLPGGKAMPASQLLNAHAHLFAAGACFDLPEASN